MFLPVLIWVNGGKIGIIVMKWNIALSIKKLCHCERSVATARNT